MELDFSQLRELLAVIDQTDVAEFTLKSGDFELVVRKGQSTNGSVLSTASVPVKEAALPPAAPSIAAAPPPSIPAAVPAVAPAPLAAEKLVDITSPMVGTFYRSPGPDEPPYVDINDRVRPGQTVCIIEAMKLMNEIEAEVTGTIVEILVQNAQPVEYGQVLMRVNPNS